MAINHQFYAFQQYTTVAYYYPDTGVGRFVVFEKVGDGFKVKQALANPGGDNEEFGVCVSQGVYGRPWAIGAPKAAGGVGKVYTWSSSGSIACDDDNYGSCFRYEGEEVGSDFGRAVEVSENAVTAFRMFVGAPGGIAATPGGLVYQYGSVKQISHNKQTDPVPMQPVEHRFESKAGQSEYGYSISSGGGWCDGDDSKCSIGTYTSSNGYFIAIGAPGDNNGATSGSVEVHYDSGKDGSWGLQDSFPGDSLGFSPGDRFGHAISLGAWYDYSEDDTVPHFLCIGAPGHNSGAGKVICFQNNDGTGNPDWKPNRPAFNSGEDEGTSAGDGFGTQVEVSDDGQVLVVASNNGYIRTYTNNNGTWTLLADGGAGETQGLAISQIKYKGFFMQFGYNLAIAFADKHPNTSTTPTASSVFNLKPN